MLNFFIILGVICIIISGLSIGAWTNGGDQRGNYHSETVEHRSFRTKLGAYSAVIGVISLLIAGLVYFLSF
ncbi:DUF5316 family protein [Lysinibacillus sp. UGB7]|uniref:DUF5316 family protein n=1 Tax=Lysinibacillus sp. UGB7 TaxID=3411039 RepID=UPI003B7BCDB5